LKIFQRRLVRSGARHKVSALDSADIRQLKNTLQLGLIQTAKLKNPGRMRASPLAIERISLEEPMPSSNSTSVG
jgi:hypothetical protein